MVLIPDTLNAAENGDPMSGIIKKLYGYSSDLINDNIVVASGTPSCPSCGTVSYSVTWEGDFSSGGIPNNFIIIRFPGRFLYPTHYTIRGVSKSWCFQKKWSVYGYNSGEENDESKWKLLAQNESTADTFCGNNDACITTKKATTFSVKQVNKGFEYIRFNTTEATQGCSSFITSGIEFFGTLSTNGRLNLNSKKVVSIYRKCTFRESMFYLRYLTLSAIKD